LKTLTVRDWLLIADNDKLISVMPNRVIACFALFLYLLTLFGTTSLAGQTTTGSVRGQVTALNGTPLEHVTIRDLDSRSQTETDREGKFSLSLSPGRHRVLAHLHSMTEEAKQINVSSGQTTELNFALNFAKWQQEVTITATGREELIEQALTSVNSVSASQIAIRTSAPALGEALESELGVTKRSFGPGTGRPVIRGFDGDRVLVLQDGARTGTVSSQSGDHAEALDPMAVERIEIVRGPQTLLYGTNAIGGVVNIISAHDDLTGSAHQGLRATVGTTFGSANALAGGNGAFEFGKDQVALWGGGGATRTGEYQTPLGKIENSETRMNNARIGAGYYGEKFSGSTTFTWQDGRYGVPPLDLDEPVANWPKNRPRLGGAEGEEIDLAWERTNLRGNYNLIAPGSGLEAVNLLFNLSSWRHNELEGDEIGTRFVNDQYSGQATIRQKRRGIAAGSFGAFALRRNFESEGEEALSPPIGQNSFAIFGVEELNFERVKLQFGGRLETNQYRGRTNAQIDNRSFTGASGSVGFVAPLSSAGSFYFNASHSYRAPALEELYFNGPHAGNVAFEIGDSRLRPERANGIEFGLRRRVGKVRGEWNYFLYDFSRLAYLARAAEFEDGLPVAQYLQNDARYQGTEFKLSYDLARWLSVNHQFDMVRASFQDRSGFVPRIPPRRFSSYADLHWKSLTLRPELLLADRQTRVFATETETAGYGVFHMSGFYTINKGRTLHSINGMWFNAGNRLYRNHLSFIKDSAPEIGRGFRVGYTVNFF
jgi:iron complex outermembrane recepter protein